MMNLKFVPLVAFLLPSLVYAEAYAENRIDCYSDANGFHTYLLYDGSVGQYKGRLNDYLRVSVDKDVNKISFKSPDVEWFRYYIDRSSGNKYSSHQLSSNPEDFEWVKVASCKLPEVEASTASG